MNEEIIKRLDQIRELTLLAAKEALDIDDVVLLTGYKKQTIYNLIHKRKIPCYKPEGHTVRFRKSEINDWLLQNRQRTDAEIDAQASLHTVFNHPTF
jgi:excisionase family DNA binding protein